MRVEYELAPEDWAAFAERCALRSRPFRQTRLYMQGLGSLAILIAVVRFIGPSTEAALLTLLLVGCWWWLAPQLLYRRVRRQAIVRDRPCLKGRHVLEADSECLRAKCDVSDSRHKWAGVRAVESQRTHVFVFVGDSLGYTVPRSRVVSGDLERFVEVANGYAGRDA